MDIICIGCPMGCLLTVTVKGSDIKVTGEQCKIGIRYGTEEATNPTRNVTTSVKIAGGDIPMLSVKTAKPIPKGKITECVKEVQNVTTMCAPVKIGDVVLTDAAGTGVDFVATRVVRAM